MALYSFKGHYPVEVIDNNKGWYEVPAKPEAPEGKEVAWVNAAWVVRDPKPEDQPTYKWKWIQGEDGWAWAKCAITIESTGVPESPVISESPAIPSVGFSII